MAPSRSTVIVLVGLLLVILASSGLVLSTGFYLLVEAGGARFSKDTAADDIESLRREANRLVRQLEQSTSARARRRIGQDILALTQDHVFRRMNLADYLSSPLWKKASTTLELRMASTFIALLGAIGVCLRRRMGHRMMTAAILVMMATAVQDAFVLARHLPETVESFTRDYRIAFQSLRDELVDDRAILGYMNDLTGIGRIDVVAVSRMWLAWTAGLPFLMLCLALLPPVRRRLAVSAQRQAVAAAVGLVLFVSPGCTSVDKDPPMSAAVVAADELLDIRRFEAAEEAFEKAALSEPDVYYPHVGLALCAVGEGDQSRFEHHAIQASALAPRTVAGWNRMGMVYVQGAARFVDGPGRARFARVGVEYLRRVFGAAPETPNLNFHLGLGLLLADDLPGASVFLEEAHLREPERVDVASQLLIVYRRLGRKERLERLIASFDARGTAPESWDVFRGAKATTRPTPE